MFDYQAKLVKIFEYYDNLHVYRPGVGAPGVQLFSELLIFSHFVHFLQQFPFKKHFTIFPIPCMDDLCRTCCKIAQCQPRVIIYIYIYMNLVEFLSLMHHAMFGNHRPSGSREEKKIQVFPIYSHFSIYWSCDLGHLYKLSFPIP